MDSESGLGEWVRVKDSKDLKSPQLKWGVMPLKETGKAG